jgi:hypothetical protein
MEIKALLLRLQPIFLFRGVGGYLSENKITKIRNEWMHTSTHLYALMACKGATSLFVSDCT